MGSDNDNSIDRKKLERLELKVDFISYLIICAFGSILGLSILLNKTWGEWSGFVSTIALIILPAYIISKYKEIP
jgi:hypothetical protein